MAKTEEKPVEETTNVDTTTETTSTETASPEAIVDETKATETATTEATVEENKPSDTETTVEETKTVEDLPAGKIEGEGVVEAEPTKETDKEDLPAGEFKTEAEKIMRQQDVNEIWRCPVLGYWFTKKEFADDNAKKVKKSAEHYKL